MKTNIAEVGARGADSYPFSLGGTDAQALELYNTGIEFIVGYLGVINKERLSHILKNNMAFMPVTLAGRYDPKTSILAIKGLELTYNCTIWLDLEGKASYDTPPIELITKINDWAQAIKDEGYQPGLYIGSPQPLTADELWRLKVVRYWKAPSRVIDRNGKTWDGPQCGFCMYQAWPQKLWRGSGVLVDVDFIQQDFLGRLPNWVISDE